MQRDKNNCSTVGIWCTFVFQTQLRQGGALMKFKKFYQILRKDGFSDELIGKITMVLCRTEAIELLMINGSLVIRDCMIWN